MARRAKEGCRSRRRSGSLVAAAVYIVEDRSLEFIGDSARKFFISGVGCALLAKPELHMDQMTSCQADFSEGIFMEAIHFRPCVPIDEWLMCLPGLS